MAAPGVARDEIRDLLGRYCELLDAGDWEGVGALFAGGLLADEHGTELARGADAVASFYGAIVQLHDGTPRTKHLVTNIVFEPSDASSGEVWVRSSYLVLQGFDGEALQPIVTGRYRDRFRHDGERWCFAERRFVIDLAGDLSRHLRT